MENTDFEGYTNIYLHHISFSNDIMLIIVLALLAVFAWTFLMNFTLFSTMIININAGEQRQSIFESTENNIFLFNSFMTFQAILLFSIYVFSAAAKYKYILNTDLKTTLLSIGLLFVLFFFYYLFKRALYALFGIVFLEKSTNKMLFTNYQALLGSWGIALYFPVLWVLLFDTYFSASVIILIFSYLLFKIIFAFRFFYVFSKKNTGILFISLYLCAQEIAPLVFLYQGLNFTFYIIERNNAWQ